MKERMAAKTVKVPLRYTTNASRVARVRKIRELMGKNQAEFAELMGMSFSYIHKVELSIRPCTMMCLKLAETIYRKHYNAEQNKHSSAVKAHASNMEANLRKEFEMPDDPAAKAQVIAAYIRGANEDDIAREYKLRLEVVQYWISTLA